MAVAVAVFFQVHVSFPAGPITVNLADPLSVLALAGIALHSVFLRQGPLWRVDHFNGVLGVMACLILLSFIHGWMVVGITQWSLFGRLFGGMVLAGYIAAGYLIVASAGTHGLRRFAETMISTAAVVVMLQICLRLLCSVGVISCTHVAFNFEGYAGNRNAFAFQLLVGVALLCAYSGLYERHRNQCSRSSKAYILALLLGILLAGICWTGSRTGMITAAIVLLVSTFGKVGDLRLISRGAVLAVVMWSGIWLLEHKELLPIWDLFPVRESLPFNVRIQSTLVNETSNYEHWATVTKGFEMWKQSPIWGAGLGVFYAQSPSWLGHPQVIHNTAVWVLAEFGLLGALGFGWAYLKVAGYAIRIRGILPSQHILILLLLVFSVFSIMHEIAYQRIFWLALGAALARPFALKHST